MKKINKWSAVLAGLVLATAASAQTVDNWKNGTNELAWKNGTNELCWRDANWTPATAAVACDGAIIARAALPVPVARSRKADGPAAAVAAAAVAAPAVTKVSFVAEALFDFDKSVLKPAGKAKLNELANKIKTISLEVVIAVGHTDYIGTVAYNQKLSVARSEAVKAYLVSKGVDPKRIYTEDKGKQNPMADNKTAEGRAKNRRVEIEVVGSRSAQ